MTSLQIKRRRKPSIEPKQALRAHVEKLPFDQQQAFVTLALQLMRPRLKAHAAEKISRTQPRL